MPCSDEIYGVIIIGSGGAGMTAAIYAVRSGMKTLVLESQVAGGLAATAPEIMNFPSYKKIAGLELMEKIKEHASEYLSINELEAAEKAWKDESGLFHVKTNASEYTGRSVIIATGATHRTLGVPGEADFMGRGVSYCATCDGYFFRGKKVLMVGGGSAALMDAAYLKNIGCDVTIVHRRNQFRAERAHVQKVEDLGIPVAWNTVVVEIKGDTAVRKVVLKNVESGVTTEVDADGVFIAVGQSPRNEIARQLGCRLDEGGYIVVDRSMRTSVPGVYAAGDVTGGVKQLIVACGEGAVAATTAFEEVLTPYWTCTL